MASASSSKESLISLMRDPRSAPVVVMPMAAAVIDDAAREAETGEGQEKSKRQSFHKGLLFLLPRGVTVPSRKLHPSRLPRALAAAERTEPPCLRPGGFAGAWSCSFV